MAWLIIVAAGMFQTGFAVFLKLSRGMTQVWPTIGFAACALASFALLTVALRELEVGADVCGVDAYRCRRGGGNRHGLPRRCGVCPEAGVDRPDSRGGEQASTCPG